MRSIIFLALTLLATQTLGLNLEAKVNTLASYWDEDTPMSEWDWAKQLAWELMGKNGNLRKMNYSKMKAIVDGLVGDGSLDEAAGSSMMSALSRKTTRGGFDVKALATEFVNIGVAEAKEIFSLNYERDHHMNKWNKE